MIGAQSTRLSYHDFKSDKVKCDNLNLRIVLTREVKRWHLRLIQQRLC